MHNPKAQPSSLHQTVIEVLAASGAVVQLTNAREAIAANGADEVIAMYDGAIMKEQATIRRLVAMIPESVPEADLLMRVALLKFRDGCKLSMRQ